MGLSNSNLKVLTVNVRGIESNGKLEQIRLLLTKHEASIAVITETETTHTYASTTHMEGWKAFCPPESVTGPQNKEAGVIMMVANELASVSKKRPDINGNDSVQTVWTEFTKHNLLVGGVYRRNKPFQPDLDGAQGEAYPTCAATLADSSGGLDDNGVPD